METKYPLSLSLLLSGLMFCMMAGAHEQELSTAQVKAWLDGYKSAWEMRDADAAAALFTADASYREQPYSSPFEGRSSIRQYWSEVTSDQRDVEFRYEILTTYGHTAIAHWTARFRNASNGTQVMLEGLFLLEFSKDGLCSSLKEWWHLQINEQEEVTG